MNIAGRDRIWAGRVGPVEVCDPGEASDRQLLVSRVSFPDPVERVGRDLALPLWRPLPAPPEERERVLALVEAGRAFLRRWRAAGFPDLREFFAREAGG